MTTITEGIWLEMVNRRNNRVIFSASTDELDKAVFDQLWAAIGDMLHRETTKKKNSLQQEFVVRISRFTKSDDD